MLFKIIEQQERRFDMIEKNRIASIIDTLIEECGECPLERICNEDECTHVWERFLEAKVKEDGVEIEEQKSYEVDHAQNYNKTLEHDADIIRKQINAGWIPVEEQLPEDGGQVLVSMYDRVTWVTIGTYNPCRKMWEVNQYITDLGIDVKAWMPLPEPYYPERSMK